MSWPPSSNSASLEERVWQSHFKQLTRWYRARGNFNIPSNRRDLTAVRLWMTTQRRLYKEEKLSDERVQLLKDIQFTFTGNANEGVSEGGDDSKEKIGDEEGGLSIGNNSTSYGGSKTVNNDQTWLVMFQQLQEFHHKHGHWCFPSHSTNSSKHEYKGLQNWVADIRAQPNTLNESQKKLLNDVGFEWGPCKPQQGGDFICNNGDGTTSASQAKEVVPMPIAQSASRVASSPITPTNLRQARHLAKEPHKSHMDGSQSKVNNSPQVGENDQPGNGGRLKKSYPSPRRARLACFFASVESPRKNKEPIHAITGEAANGVISSKGEDSKQAANNNPVQVRAVAQASHLQGSTEILLRNARAKAYCHGKQQENHIESIPTSTDKRFTDNSAFPGVQPHAAKISTSVSETETEQQSTCASNPQFEEGNTTIQTSATKMKESTARSAKKSLSSSDDKLCYTENPAKKPFESFSTITHTGAEKSLHKHEESHAYVSSVSSSSDIEKNQMTRLCPSTSGSKEESDTLLPDDTEELPLAALSSKDKRQSKWLSIWEAIVDDNNNEDQCFMNASLKDHQLPDEIFVQPNADMSVITIDNAVDYWPSKETNLFPLNHGAYENQEIHTNKEKPPCQKQNTSAICSGSNNDRIANCHSGFAAVVENKDAKKVLNTSRPFKDREKEGAMIDSQNWMKNYYSLSKFYKKHSHFSLPVSREYETLRAWLIEQKQMLSNDSSCDVFPVHRRRLLESLFAAFHEEGHERSQNQEKSSTSPPPPSPKSAEVKKDASSSEKHGAVSTLQEPKSPVAKKKQAQTRPSFDVLNGYHSLTPPNKTTYRPPFSDRPLQEITSARSITNQLNNQATSLRPQDNSRGRCCRKSEAMLPRHRVYEFKTYLGQVDSQIREKEMELKTLREVAVRIYSLLQNVDATGSEKVPDK